MNFSLLIRRMSFPCLEIKDNMWDIRRDEIEGIVFVLLLLN